MSFSYDISPESGTKKQPRYNPTFLFREINTGISFQFFENIYIEIIELIELHIWINELEASKISPEIYLLLTSV